MRRRRCQVQEREGPRLVTFRPFPDGRVRVDVNLYDSIVSVDDGSITDRDGRCWIRGVGRFFVIVENRDADQT